jgi:hypothetical protein
MLLCVCLVLSLYMRPHTGVYVSRSVSIYASAYCCVCAAHMCVLILLYTLEMRPHTAVYLCHVCASSNCSMCVVGGHILYSRHLFLDAFAFCCVCVAYICIAIPMRLHTAVHVSYDLLYVYVSQILVRCICVSYTAKCVCVRHRWAFRAFRCLKATSAWGLKLLVYGAFSY